MLLIVVLGVILLMMLMLCDKWGVQPPAPPGSEAAGRAIQVAPLLLLIVI